VKVNGRSCPLTALVRSVCTLCSVWFGNVPSLSDRFEGNFDPVGFDEMLVPSVIVPRTERACKEDGGLEGGVSSSSDDEADSIPEELSETREGVRDTGCEETFHPGRVGGGTIRSAEVVP